MFKSHLAFLCFHTPPVPASVGPLRCQVALDLGALPETRSMGPAASPGSDVFKRSSDATYCIQIQDTFGIFWLEMVGWWLDAFFYSQFPHDFDLAGATKSASSRCRLAPSMAQTLHRLLEPLPGLENRDQKNLMKTDGQLGEKLRNVLWEIDKEDQRRDQMKLDGMG